LQGVTDARGRIYYYCRSRKGSCVGNDSNAAMLPLRGALGAQARIGHRSRLLRTMQRSSLWPMLQGVCALYAADRECRSRETGNDTETYDDFGRQVVEARR